MNRKFSFYMIRNETLLFNIQGSCKVGVQQQQNIQLDSELPASSVRQHCGCQVGCQEERAHVRWLLWHLTVLAGQWQDQPGGGDVPPDHAAHLLHCCSFNRQHNISKWYVLIFIIYHTNFDFSLIRYFDSDVRSGRVLNVSNIRTEHGRIQHWRWSQLLLLWRPGFHSRRRTTPWTSLMFDDVISIKKAMINVNGVNSSRY